MFFDYQHFAGLLGCYFSANYFVVLKCKTINSLLYDDWDVNLLVKGTPMKSTNTDITRTIRILQYLTEYHYRITAV